MPGTPATPLPITAGSAVPTVEMTTPELIPLPGQRPTVAGGARGKPSDGSPSRGKLYIKTHGCQMNEYDSAKMADVLAAAEGLELTDNPEEADVVL
ncbi:MAG: hypothetical protein ACN6OR_10905, partial [Stenotrophomonas sp.]